MTFILISQKKCWSQRKLPTVLCIPRWVIYWMACWFMWQKDWGLLKLFVFYCTYGVLANDWDVNPGILVGNTLLVYGVARCDHQPKRPDNWVVILAQPEFVCVTLGRSNHSSRWLSTYSTPGTLHSLFGSLEQWYEAKTISMSVLEMKEQNEVQGVEWSCHGSWPPSLSVVETQVSLP